MSQTWFVERKECPACTSRDFKIIYQSPYDQAPVKTYLDNFYSPQGGVEHGYLAGATYILCECRHCRLLFQRDIPNDQLMERLYDHWIDPRKVFALNTQAQNLAYYARNAQEVMRMVAFSGKEPSSLKVLDFGMGWAEWAMMAKAFGLDSYGMELSKERIEHARKNGIVVIDWDEVPGQTFDIINTEQVFEHIPEPLQTLKHLSKGLKPGGLIKISVPTANDIERRLHAMDWNAPKGSPNSLNAVAPLEHINYYRRKTFAEMGKKAGLQEVQLPIKIQLQFAADSRGIKQKLKNLFFPFYLNVLKKRNYVFLKKINSNQPPGIL